MTQTAAKTKEVKPAAIFYPRTQFELRLGWPAIYPEHRDKPFVFHMRTQLVSEAEKLQRDFLMAQDDERTDDLQHQHDAAMLGLLSTSAPDNVPGFPETDEAGLAKAVQEFFYPKDQERREAMRYIVRAAMSRYWQAVLPADYL